MYSEMNPFIAAIERDPSDATTRKVLADYLEDHPHLVPESDRWAKLLRHWSPETVVIVGADVCPETACLFRVLSIGCAKRIIRECCFRDMPGDGLDVREGDLVESCVMKDNAGYGWRGTGGLVRACTAINNTAGMWSPD